MDKEELKEEQRKESIGSLRHHPTWLFFKEEIHNVIGQAADELVRMDPQKELVEMCRLQGLIRALEILIRRPDEIYNYEKLKLKRKGEST